MDKYKFQKEDFTDAEIWCIETMVRQMNELTYRLDLYPIYTDIRSEWYHLKEKMGWEDIY